MKRTKKDKPRPEDRESEIFQVPMSLTLPEIERSYILATLVRFNGVKAHTAKFLKIGLKTLFRKLEQYKKEPI